MSIYIKRYNNAPATLLSPPMKTSSADFSISFAPKRINKKTITKTAINERTGSHFADKLNVPFRYPAIKADNLMAAAKPMVHPIIEKKAMINPRRNPLIKANIISSRKMRSIIIQSKFQ